MNRFFEPVKCPVCESPAPAYDVVDFNRSCEELRGHFLPLSGEPVYYHRCDACAFCFAPEMMRWSHDEFKTKVYNDGYAAIDPDYAEVRPKGNADGLIAMFGGVAGTVRHLDYGGGNGALSARLSAAGWNSRSYDPFANGENADTAAEKFDLITAFEVFEHVPDPRRLADELEGLLTDDGILLFSTLLSDGEIPASGRNRISWWYAAPRNGHISLYSRRSLESLWSRKGFRFGSFNQGFHTAFRTVPAWASHVIRL